MKPLSYTQIALYQSCPLCYKLQHVDGLRPKDKWYFSFGTTLHLCAQFFFRVRVPPPPTLPQLLAFYEANWLGEGYASAEEEANYRTYGREILTRFWKAHHTDFNMPFAVEHPFYIDVDGVKLRGFIDRVDKLDGDTLSIVDYKSNQKMFTSEEVEESLQLTLYQMAAEQCWRLPVERLTLYHLRSNTPFSCHPRNSSRLEEARRLVLETAENIARSIFPAKENAYCPCDFPEHCPYYRHKYAPPEAKTEVIPITEAVERYVALQGQMKALEQELDEIKSIITSFCETQGINRVYSPKHAITYKLVERVGYIEDEIKALLEPMGLWQKVVSLDTPRLKKLLTDEELAGEIRRMVESLKRVTSSYPQLWVKKLTEEE